MKYYYKSTTAFTAQNFTTEDFQALEALRSSVGKTDHYTTPVQLITDRKLSDEEQDCLHVITMY